MRIIQIFELFMRCSPVLGSVGVDPELLRVSTALKILQKNGIEVERFNLSDLPLEFIRNKETNQLISDNNFIGRLPITVLDEEIVITSRYPTNEEFAKIFNIPVSYFSDYLNGFPQSMADNNNFQEMFFMKKCKFLN